MAEPSASTFVITGVVAAALGPVFGPAVLIAFGAVAGSLLAMSKADTMSKWEALRFVAVGVVVAMSITGIAAWALERWAGVPTNVALMPVAALIAAVRQHILGFMEQLMGLLAALARTKGGGQ